MLNVKNRALGKTERCQPATKSRLLGPCGVCAANPQNQQSLRMGHQPRTEFMQFEHRPMIILREWWQKAAQGSKVWLQKEHNVTWVHGNNYESPKLLQLRHFPSKGHALGSEEAWAVSKRMKSSRPWGKRERCLWLLCSRLSLHPATPSTRAGSSACSISKINHQPECFWSVSQANHLVTNPHPLSAKLPVLLNGTSRS